VVLVASSGEALHVDGVWNATWDSLSLCERWPSRAAQSSVWCKVGNGPNPIGYRQGELAGLSLVESALAELNAARSLVGRHGFSWPWQRHHQRSRRVVEYTFDQVRRNTKACHSTSRRANGHLISHASKGPKGSPFPDPNLAAQAKIFASEATIKIVNDAEATRAIFRWSGWRGTCACSPSGARSQLQSLAAMNPRQGPIRRGRMDQ
jgi:hypothetical protein